jgi:diadenosine tetraphosphate (Ap4A) HIT family hydrolase
MSIAKLIGLAEAGRLDRAICRLPSGWLIAGDVQPLKGYCVLLADPVVTDFNHLTEKGRAQWGVDFGAAGDALLSCLGAYRINYETWGNLEPALHTHIVPRYMAEPENLRVQTPRQAYDWGGGRPFHLEENRDWMDAVKRFLQGRAP